MVTEKDILLSRLHPTSTFDRGRYSDVESNDATTLRRKRSMRREPRVQHDASDESAERTSLGREADGHKHRHGRHGQQQSLSPSDARQRKKLGDDVRQAEQSTSTETNRYITFRFCFL